MKLLHDLKVFPEILFDHSNEKEGCTYFSKGKIFRSKLTEFPACPKNALFWIASIWEEVFKGVYCQKRINSNFLALEHIIQGSMYFRQDDHCYLLEENDFFLLRPGGVIEMRTAGKHYCQKESIILSGALLNSALQMMGLEKANYLQHVDDLAFKEILTSGKMLLKDYQHNLFQKLEHFSYDLLLLLKKPADNAIPQALKELIAYMELNLDKKFSLEKLAEYYGCSESHLIRIFHRYFNTTPYKFLQGKRMKYAQRMLSDTELSVKEIAFSVGYENSMNFSTEFKKHIGKSPKSYRKKH